MAASVKSPRRAVFVLFGCLYLLSLGGGFYSSDGEVMFKTTTALVERHSLALAADPGLPQIIQGKNNLYYSKYDPGLPLIGVPFYAAGDWIAQINHAHRTRLAAIFYLMIPALSAAGSLAGLAALIGGNRRAMAILLAAGLASPLWVYGRTLFAEAALACALTWAVAAISLQLSAVSQSENANRRGAASSTQNLPLSNRVGEGVGGEAIFPVFAAGIIFGIGMLIRVSLVIYLPALVWMMIGPHPWHKKQDPECRGAACRAQFFHALPQWAAFAAGMLPFVLILGWHNGLRFGNPFEFGYAGEGFTTPPWKGIAGLLISPGKGIFIYAPPLILSAILWPRFRKTAPALADFLALAWITALLFYGSWWAWDGGWCWGPRFLVPLIPLSTLPLLALPPGRCWRLLLAGLILAGIVVQFPGVITDVIPHYAETAAGQAADINQINFTISDSPLAGAIRRLWHGQPEPLAVFHLHDTGLPLTWTAGVPAVLIAGALIVLWSIIKDVIIRRDKP
ncbi:MAG: hypothetical protein HY866_07295 [Chloroflexi bacterium]|nr:hypothetical protein [Chloroflexota bacterium]